MFRFASLGSGSQGNATLVQTSKTAVLVDCGFGMRETASRLASFELTLADLDAIIITHEHGDHVKGVGAIARKQATPVYMTEGTFQNRDYGAIPNLQLIQGYQPFSVGDLDVEPIAVPHDSAEPAQFILSCGRLRLGVITDLGQITAHILERYHGCQALLAEANHDLQMLALGPYPASLKARVSGGWGHLNNLQTKQFLESVLTKDCQHLIVGHMSEKNNRLAIVQEVLNDVVAHVPNVIYAEQDQQTHWCDIS